MSQHDYVIANGTGAAVRSDLNNALAAIVSQNSGATEPATMYAYQWWADTTTGLLKLRNAANNAWITLRELDGTLTIEAGTVSAPGLAFASDLNTGVWSPGADQFAIATNGVERVEWGTSEVVFNDGGANYDFRIEGDTNSALFFVDASAEAVGIGVTSPTSALTVNGSISTPERQNAVLGVNVATSDGNGGNLTVKAGGGKGVGATSGALYLGFGRGASTASNGFMAFGQAQSTDVQGLDTEYARIDSSGRLLVGTSTAVSTINYAGGDRIPRFQVVGDNTDNGSIAIIRTGTAPSAFFGAGASGTNVASSNNIGGIVFTGYHTNKYYTGAVIAAEVDGTPGANDMPGRLVFSTTADGASSPTERMRIGNGGLTSIGGVYTFTTGNAANVNVDSSGYLQRSTSSIKYKTDVETLDDQYADALLACRPVWYRSTCEHDCSEHSYWGFIAEEVASIDPRLVHWKTTEITHDENGVVVSTPCTPEPEGVQYERFVPHLLNLIKRQKEQIEAMEVRLTALETA